MSLRDTHLVPPLWLMGLRVQIVLSLILRSVRVFYSPLKFRRSSKHSASP